MSWETELREFLKGFKNIFEKQIICPMMMNPVPKEKKQKQKTKKSRKRGITKGLTRTSQ